MSFPTKSDMTGHDAGMLQLSACHLVPDQLHGGARLERELRCLSTSPGD